MAVRLGWTSNTDQSLKLLAEHMYAQEEKPTYSSLKQAAMAKDQKLLDPNLLSSYFGSLEEALDKAEAYLKRSHPDWTPPWFHGTATVRRPRSTAAAMVKTVPNRDMMLMQKGVGVIKLSKERQLSDDERYYLDLLVGKCQENDGVLPTYRQIEKDSFINAKTLMKTLAKGRGWQGVLYELKQELKRQGIEYTEVETADSGLSHSYKNGRWPKHKKKGNGMQNAAQDAGSDVDQSETLEPTGSSEIQEDAQLPATEPSVAATTSVVAEQAATEESAPQEAPARKRGRPRKTLVAEVGAGSSTQMAAFSYTTYTDGAKKRGRKPEEFNRDDEIAKLYKYRQMLDGKNPTPARLQRLAKEHPDEKITCGATLERRLGPYQEWPTLIDAYIANKNSTAE